MLQFSTTKNPVELYIIAVKNQGTGIGKVLVKKMLEKSKEIGYTEVVLYSEVTHKESGDFYDRLHFKKLGHALGFDDVEGFIWGMTL